jgi:hypothetical protein
MTRPAMSELVRDGLTLRRRGGRPFHRYTSNEGRRQRRGAANYGNHDPP